jgi:hypothetical protein
MRGGVLSIVGVGQDSGVTGENLHDVATPRILVQNRSDDDVPMQNSLQMLGLMLDSSFHELSQFPTDNYLLITRNCRWKYLAWS